MTTVPGSDPEPLRCWLGAATGAIGRDAHDTLSRTGAGWSVHRRTHDPLLGDSQAGRKWRSTSYGRTSAAHRPLRSPHLRTRGSGIRRRHDSPGGPAGALRASSERGLCLLWLARAGSATYEERQAVVGAALVRGVGSTGSAFPRSRVPAGPRHDAKTVAGLPSRAPGERVERVVRLFGDSSTGARLPPWLAR